MSNVIDTKGLITGALEAMRGPLGDCEHHSEECREKGHAISEAWADAAGMPRIHLCETHRAEFWEVFVK